MEEQYLKQGVSDEERRELERAILDRLRIRLKRTIRGDGEVRLYALNDNFKL